MVTELKLCEDQLVLYIDYIHYQYLHPHPSVTFFIICRLT